jgi:hypothetical protein
MVIVIGDIVKIAGNLASEICEFLPMAVDKTFYSPSLGRSVQWWWLICVRMRVYRVYDSVQMQDLQLT